MKGKCRISTKFGSVAMGSNPASIHIPTGEISVNPLFWDKLTEEERKVIITHEKGHYVNQNADEIAADKFLIDNYGITIENLYQIAKVIDKFVPDTEQNLKRKQEILKNLLSKSEEIKNNSETANISDKSSTNDESNSSDDKGFDWGWLGPTIGGILGIAGSILPSILPLIIPGSKTRSAWQNMDAVAKSKTINNLYFNECYKAYLKGAGDWNSVIQKSTLSDSNTSSIGYKVWKSMAKQGLFNNGSNEKDLASISFWSQYSKPKLSDLQYPIQIKYKQESILIKAISLPVVQVLLVGAAVFIIYKLITRKK